MLAADVEALEERIIELQTVVAECSANTLLQYQRNCELVEHVKRLEAQLARSLNQ